MPVKYFVSLGRVALITQGPEKGRLCVIIDVIDQNRALVSGPNTGVKRQAIQFKKLRLTKFKIKDIHHTIGDKKLAIKWKDSEVSAKFKKTKMGMDLKAKRKREKLTDWDRFRLYKVKQKANKMIRQKTLSMLSRAKKKVTKTDKKDTTPKTVKPSK